MRKYKEIKRTDTREIYQGSIKTSLRTTIDINC